MKSLRYQTIRRPKVHISALTYNCLHLRNPWTVVWWSAALPGFGQVLVGRVTSGSVLFIWELVVNTQAHLNLAILYAFTGHYDMAVGVVDTRWLLLYVPVWTFAMYNSHRTVVETNKLSILADRWDAPIYSSALEATSFNFLCRRHPWVAVMWSAFMPGLGQIYNQKVPEGFFCLGLTIIVAYFSRICEAVQLTMIGQFASATTVLDPTWALFLPSIYGFSMYLAYQNTVEGNKLYETEQSRFLRGNYQHPGFTWPV